MRNNKFRVGGYLRLSREDGDKEESDSIGSQRSKKEEVELQKELEKYQHLPRKDRRKKENIRTI